MQVTIDGVPYTRLRNFIADWHCHNDTSAQTFKSA
jgi:hypothetical protein